MPFEIVGTITNIETIAVGAAIQDIARIRQRFGRGRWRKLKGNAVIKLSDGTIRQAEVHWYEANGIGRRLIKIKHFLD